MGVGVKPFTDCSTQSTTPFAYVASIATPLTLQRAQHPNIPTSQHFYAIPTFLRHNATTPQHHNASPGEIGLNFLYHVPDDEPHHMWRLWLGTVVSMAIASVFFCFPFGRERIKYGGFSLSTWVRCTGEARVWSCN